MCVLIVAAHPDDEVLGCGGTIARLAREGQDVYIAILGEGISSRYMKREDADRGLIESLKACSRRAAGLLGARDIFFYDLPDNRFDTMPLLNLIKIVEALVDRLQPKVLYTHHGSDLNIDHVLLHRAVLTATRPLAGQPVKELYAFEIPSSTEWTFGKYQPAFCPNVFFDVSHTLTIKIQAMEIYESEGHPFPHPRSIEALKTMALLRGSSTGLAAAEAFELIRHVHG